MSDKEIERRLGELDSWVRKGNTIERDFRLKDFAESLVFVNAVAEIAEKRNHHPDIGISWNRVTMSITTHAQGGLTDSDFDLATDIDKI